MMRTTTLGHTGLTTTVLGYGCAGLTRPVAAADRTALLAAAFDVGIRHFDVARYYGHGGAEGVLGEFLAKGGLRDQVTITTKFGIEPSALGQSARGKSLITMARRVASLHPWIRRKMAGYANRAVRGGRFDPPSAERSLETSLRELRTDRIDLFLLHGATPGDVQTPGLIEFLENAKSAGKIRAFGVGTDAANIPGISAQSPEYTRVVQIANGAGHWHLAQMPLDPGQGIITHGALKELPSLESMPVSEWEKFGPSLPGLLLGLSLHENPGGITLFSSVRPERVRGNAEAALGRASLDAAAWADFKSRLQPLPPAPDVG